jgi:GTP-binding protein HflX
MVDVFNKCDKLGLFETSPNVVYISAKQKAGLDELLEAVADMLPEEPVNGRFLFPYGEEKALSRIYDHGRVDSVSYTDEGIEAEITLDKRKIHLLEKAKVIT